ncbi:hypothetical protein ACPOL_4313 [Acidisarcina polymorpha]|uniref:Uncharacterized protein n=1 Tax=Acidisarcina polymorpha TaxID=2211140 RepID=A0A2Z5G3A2_9BACT|nr:hypothetical protein [Acidisarcina polymorpha]AXC13588.1 hypothetical protein ACPOL_4313 [Acidisarcina polymorpha]
MENPTEGINGALLDGVTQLAAAAAQLQKTALVLEERWNGAGAPQSGEVAKVVATIDPDPAGRITELEARLQTAEQQIAELRAQASLGVSAAGASRKTLPVAASHLLAKHGIDTLEQVNGGALDAALVGLSLEQRIAVKSQLMRAGLLG